MPVKWTLKKWLVVKHDIYRASELQERILERTGVAISRQTLGDLLRGRLKALKLSTVEVLCTTFQCKLSDFCEVVPGKIRPGRPRKLHAAHGRRKNKRAIAEFPSPAGFQSPRAGGAGTHKGS